MANYLNEELDNCAEIIGACPRCDETNWEIDWIFDGEDERPICICDTCGWPEKED